MWELDIIINYRYRKYLFYIKEYISASKYNTTKGLYAIISERDNAIMSIALVNPSKELLAEVKSVIAECIVVCEKEKYIHSLKICCNQAYKSAIVKTLTMIDINEDIEYAKSILDIDSKSINIHSYFHFKMQLLKKKWKELYNKLLPDKNIGDEIVLQLLKDIIDTNSQEYIVHIRHTDGKYIIDCKELNPITATSEADIISHLILLSPKELHLNQSQFSADGIILLSYLFDNKLKL
ncbi:MAG: hypothetical protein E7361_04225 [Clostridiales bacterium]|nr:hypothetical protein [Clostridiales bacterium]